MPSKLKIKKLHPDAVLPKFALPGDVGMDLFAVQSHEIKPNQIAHIPTGIAMELPKGHAGLVWDKSGLSHKHGLKTLGGVLDEGYRGDITIGLINLSNKNYTVQKGDKVAQILIQKIERPRIVISNALSKSKRGEGRYGSTGKK
jgi:dUTP pyrophosphatase